MCSGSCYVGEIEKKLHFKNTGSENPPISFPAERRLHRVQTLLTKNTKLTPPPEAIILFWIYFWNLCGAQYNLITSFSANLIYTIYRTACLLALRHSTYYSDSSILNQGQTQTKKTAF